MIQHPRATYEPISRHWLRTAVLGDAEQSTEYLSVQ